MTSIEKKKVQNHIAKGEIEDAINALSEILNGTTYFQEIVLISGRLERLNQSIRIGTISENNKILEQNNISHALINLTEILDKIERKGSENEVDKIKPLQIKNENFINVTGGKFKMGNNYGTIKERPEHEVVVDDFETYKYPVTVNEYKLFCLDRGKGLPPPPKWGWKNNHPIVNINWYDAKEFCEWANVRLLTEAEWEYAAKGGKLSQGFPYSGNLLLTEVGWYYDNSKLQTQKVGLKQPNELGLFDMTGNVWEWCYDAYSDEFYSKSPHKNPINEGSKYSDRIARGGSWYSYSKNLKLTYRYKNFPTECREDLGFRIAKK
ncbi:MAG: SUMF1/EgtB/PvdO family nonheme iron enzyme [Lewinellaceae bacterium]|nr:SUMF1/EgtB/PvdO family nonheme iron enzyme [Lewinellaceae bacterium]